MSGFGESVPALLRWLEESYPSGAEKMSPAELLEAATTWCSERDLPQPGKVILASVLKGLPERVTAGRGRGGRWYQLASMTGLQGSEAGLALLLEAGAEPVVTEVTRLEGAPSRVPPAALTPDAPPHLEGAPSRSPSVANAPDTPPRVEGAPSRSPAAANAPDIPAELVVPEAAAAADPAPDFLPDPITIQSPVPAMDLPPVDASPAPQPGATEKGVGIADTLAEPQPGPASNGLALPKALNRFALRASVGASPTPTRDDGILVSAPRPRPTPAAVPEAVAPSYAGGVAGTPVEQASDEKIAAAAVAHKQILKRKGQGNADPLTYVELSVLGKIPRDATLHPNRPPVKLLIEGREGEAWRLVASRGLNLLLVDGTGKQLAVCPVELATVVEEAEKVSSLDRAAASLAETFRGTVTEYREPEPELAGVAP